MKKFLYFTIISIIFHNIIVNASEESLYEPSIKRSKQTAIGTLYRLKIITSNENSSKNELQNTIDNAKRSLAILESFNSAYADDMIRDFQLSLANAEAKNLNL